MANRQVKKYLTSLVIKETQIKTMWYCCTFIKWLEWKRQYQCWWDCGPTGAFICCQWGCKLVELLWKTVWPYLPNLNICLPYNPVILLTVITAEMLTVLPKDTYQNDHTRIFGCNSTLENTQRPISKRMKTNKNTCTQWNSIQQQEITTQLEWTSET